MKLFSYLNIGQRVATKHTLAAMGCHSEGASDLLTNLTDLSISGLPSKRMFFYGAFSHKCQFIDGINFHGLKCLRKLEEGSYMFKGQT